MTPLHGHDLFLQCFRGYSWLPAMHIATCYHRLIYRELGALPWRENQTPQSRPIAMVSSISAYFFNTSVRYSGGIETACAAIWASIPSVRPPNPHLPASMRFTIRSPASSLKRISAQAPHSLDGPEHS